MLQRCGAESSRMMNTVFSKTIFFLLLCFFLGGGCVIPSGEERTLEKLRYAVRLRMLNVQRSDLLSSAAQERYNPRKAAACFDLGSGYQEQVWRVDNDPALQVLEDAISYALLAVSDTLEKTAEKLTAAQLDYGTNIRFLKLKSGKSSLDSAAELAMMTGWSTDKVNSFVSVPLPEIKFELFPLYPETERLLNEKGRAAAFQTAAELYRTPSKAGILKAERLRRAILNRVLMQTKSSGPEMTPELYIAFWRSRIFSSLLPLY